MLKYKRIRSRGKVPLSKYFQALKPGDVIAVAEELSMPLPYKRMQGRTGRVIGKRGEAYEVEIKDLNKPKRYLIRPVHLKRIELGGAK